MALRTTRVIPTILISRPRQKQTKERQDMMAIVGTTVIVGVAIVATAVGVYLFVRNNKQKVAKIEQAIADIKAKLKD